MEIYGGRGPFKGSSIDRRYEIIDLMGEIFEKFKLPILYQTSSPQFLSERPLADWLGHDRLGPLNLKRHDHVSLLYLLFRVRRFMQEYKHHFVGPLPAVVDEGLFKAGTTLQIPRWDDEFEEGRIQFRRSHEFPLIQLADFAAFVIGRGQWLLGKGDLKPLDRKFLKLVSAERLCVIDMPSITLDPERHATEDYDEFLRQDRRAKGLPHDPAAG